MEGEQMVRNCPLKLERCESQNGPAWTVLIRMNGCSVSVRKTMEGEQMVRNCPLKLERCKSQNGPAWTVSIRMNGL